MGRWRRSITRHRSSLSKTTEGKLTERLRDDTGGIGRTGEAEERWCRTWIGTGLRLALHSFACRELSYNYLSACNGSTGIATANATTG